MEVSAGHWSRQRSRSSIQDNVRYIGTKGQGNCTDFEIVIYYIGSMYDSKEEELERIEIVHADERDWIFRVLKVFEVCM